MANMSGSTTMTLSQAADAARFQLEWEKGHGIKMEENTSANVFSKFYPTAREEVHCVMVVMSLNKGQSAS